MIDRPVAPMLVVRVETDWYPHETEFRYVLQQGEGIPGAYNLPIGQVLFVPRDEITMRDCREDELAAIRTRQGGVLARESGIEGADLDRPSIQPALLASEPGAEVVSGAGSERR